MLVTLLLSFFAGMLTAFAPCILPLLPVILGGSFDPNDRDKKRPYIITASLIASLVLFTLLLKASTVLIGVDPEFWVYLSGGLVITIGLFMLFPNAWARLILMLGFEHRSQALLGKASKNQNHVLSAILVGAALGPVFSSCSPTYAYVIATVIPSNVALGMVYLTAYCIGLAITLLAIALLGRRLLEKVKWASNPSGWFQRTIAILFILVGLFIVTGWDKKVQTWLVDKDIFHLIKFEEKLVPISNKSQSVKSMNNAKKNYNVDPYKAPNFVGIDQWINSDKLSIDSLKGKVVLVDFWTYSCINCQRTQPYLNDWYGKYKDKGLVIVGVHAPEFAFERVGSNVEQAVKDAEINYPIALDNSFSTWRAYDNQFWPAKYLIDKDGLVRFTHFGEGKYDETEKVIQELLSETGQKDLPEVNQDSNTTPSGQLTPETYIGYGRGERFANLDQFKKDQTVKYSFAKNLALNNWTLDGDWKVGSESSEAMSNDSKLGFRVSGSDVFVVMNGKPGSRVKIDFSDGQKHYGSDVDKNGYIIIDKPRLYKIAKYNSNQSTAQFTLTFQQGVTVNAFTFGAK